MTCPLIKGEHVYFANDLGRAGCFVAKTGKKVWFETIDSAFYASPIMIDGNIYAASERGDVYVFAGRSDRISTTRAEQPRRNHPRHAGGRQRRVVHSHGEASVLHREMMGGQLLALR